MEYQPFVKACKDPWFLGKRKGSKKKQRSVSLGQGGGGGGGGEREAVTRHFRKYDMT